MQEEISSPVIEASVVEPGLGNDDPSLLTAGDARGGLGTGVVVNAILKENWGRPRPVDIQTFGGAGTFEPALHPSNQCNSNCSFVSGHAATGFTLLALGLLGAPATRRRWLLWGLAAGLSTGALRIAQGGHFLSDVLFSGLVIWLCGAALRTGYLYLRARRQRRLRLAQG